MSCWYAELTISQDLQIVGLILSVFALCLSLKLSHQMFDPRRLIHAIEGAWKLSLSWLGGLHTISYIAIERREIKVKWSEPK